MGDWHRVAVVEKGVPRWMRVWATGPVRRAMIADMAVEVGRIAVPKVLVTCFCMLVIGLVFA